MTLPDSIPDVELKTAADQILSVCTSESSRTTSEKQKRLFHEIRQKYKVDERFHSLATHFPTVFTAISRLPFDLVVFAFSQFILIEGLVNQGWIDIFAGWLVRASNHQMIPTIWIVGVMGVLLCNIAGTNIGATILLTKVINAANMPNHTTRAAAVSLAVASNIGAVSFTFSASLAGLLWVSILQQMNVHKITQVKFAIWNALPLLFMTGVGLAVVTAEMMVHYRGDLKHS
jgi:Na+/H+ antiporter NhaD/arsenite permease-like protein